MAELNLGHMGHGGDYNPDQWRHIPGTLEKDIELMKKSGCNLMSVGIFSWAALEPEEGVFDFGWLRKVLDTLQENGIGVFLATPSGARPAWMDDAHPEVMRTLENGMRAIHGERHNHCYTSPTYRAFVKRINTRLAEEFGHHPAVKGWHISNEYGGECHCEACQNAFRAFLQEKYGTLDELNQQWWTGFWAKTYTDWNQLHSPSSLGEHAVHGLTLDWKRFVTRQTVDFMKAECESIRRICPELPVTTNMHGAFGLDYWRFEDVIDFASYDAYPAWGSAPDADVAAGVSFWYDAIRALKQKPWALMESTPSVVNWMPICKPKRPGIHKLASLQAVAHGADTVQYFQFRKSRGACEKLHGAIVGHDGTDDTRVFREVAEVGTYLKELTEVCGTRTDAKAAVIFDQDNRYALESANGVRRDKQYLETVMEHHRALKNLGIDVDVIDSEKPFDGYSLIAAPMLYLLKPGVAERLEAFAQRGGTLVVTYFTGLVNENDLCFLDFQPGPLRRLLGVRVEETDSFYPGQGNTAVFPDGTTRSCGFIADVLKAEGAQVCASYGEDYYAGTPAVTKNCFGKGAAWYLASRFGAGDLTDFYRARLAECGIEPLLSAFDPDVQVTSRGDLLFVLNFSGQDARAVLPSCVQLVTGEPLEGEITLHKNDLLIVRRN